MKHSHHKKKSVHKKIVKSVTKKNGFYVESHLLLEESSPEGTFIRLQARERRTGFDI